MFMDITLVECCGNYARYQIGGCNFSIYHDNNPGRQLSSFGGVQWPSDFPSVFEHFGPDIGCITYRSGMRVREGIVHPIAR